MSASRDSQAPDPRAVQADARARVERLFEESVAVKRRAAGALPTVVAQAAQLLIGAFRAGAKVLVCGNGGSAADAQHLAAELVNRFEVERPGLPALALTTDASILTSVANDDDFDRVFRRQVEALGRAGDVLVAISTSGSSANVIEAVRAAHAREMRVILLGGRSGGEAARALDEGDVAIVVPSESTARVQEVHVLVIHCLCDLVDRSCS